MDSATDLKLANRGLMTIFIDKVIKLLHVAMMHPRDYSVDLIGKWMTQKSGENRNWLYLVKMFRYVDHQQPAQHFYGHLDIKLALCRFIAELLIRLPASSLGDNRLDEIVNMPFDGKKYMENGLED